LAGQLEPIVKSPTVYVYIANFIISVLGEVARPAQYVIPHNRITLPEALALAGDLTIYGKRQNVMIVRELNGNRVFGQVDLTNKNLFRSPYYYLRSGDIIYVEPTKGKLTSIDRTYQLMPIIISSLSFILLIINTLK
jgi:polysaccharide export outer membrane protein